MFDLKPRLASLRKGDLDRRVLPWSTVMALTAGLCIATAALVWLGYVATREWSHGTTQLLAQRQAEALSLVGAAVSRDMRGVWTTVILPINTLTVQQEPPHDMVQLSARAFARFPYPESFISWKDNGSVNGVTYVFSRSDRSPPWDLPNPGDETFPVILRQNPTAIQDVVRALRRQATPDNSFTLVEVDIGGVPYQVIARFMFESTRPEVPVGLTAFTVNLLWMRQDYFGPLLTQVARIGGYEDTLALAVFDDSGSLIATTGSRMVNPSGPDWRFPVMFLDASTLASSRWRPPSVPVWSVRVRPETNNTDLAALNSQRRMFTLMVLAAGVSMLALMMTLGAIRANAILATMKSDFVSAVTHELKTPLALIRLVGDTLSGGRYASKESVQEYAALLSQGTERLSQSIDSLLTVARYSDSNMQARIDIKPSEVGVLVEDSLECFRPMLEQLDFDVSIDVPHELPCVLVDRVAMTHVMENVIDNAIKYSDLTRSLRITGRTNGKHVRVTFADRGTGIAPDDLARVCDRFYRGRNARHGGSGLGLAIARRVMRVHGGKLNIRSTPNIGTEVDLLLVAEKRA